MHISYLSLLTQVTFDRDFKETLASVLRLVPVRIIGTFQKRLGDRKIGILLSVRGHRCIGKICETKEKVKSPSREIGTLPLCFGFGLMSL